MPDSATPSPPSTPPTPASSHSATMMRNIITGVITTVIGAVTVYFITQGFHKSDNSSAADILLMKEVTTNAWKSYVSSENVFYNNWNIDIGNYTT
ncbi:MAG: hypothetical protein ACHQEB_06690, partial [Chitinophagales bacterium]